jgi:hypothetical protein
MTISESAGTSRSTVTHLVIGIDRVVNPDQETLGLKVGEMFLQIKPRLRVLRAPLLRRDDFVHG